MVTAIIEIPREKARPVSASGKIEKQNSVEKNESNMPDKPY